MYSKILIANRGEIAVRIIRACNEMGISTVAVYSEADRESMHVALADEAYCIGPAAPTESYLNQDRIISAALVSGAQAIHPGYGFLSENDQFAEACARNGIVFIGPTPENMKALSDKAKVKAEMEKAGLPVIPGSQIVKNAEQAKKKGAEIGYPVMLKLRSGGGGRGIRLVNSEAEIEKAFNVASQEGEKAFGDGALYIEKYIYPARHVEVQVIADEEGNVACLGERDCSIQRNHQKLIEESPSPAVTEEKRNELFPKIMKAIKDIKYVGVATLEFLVDKEGNFYFMEMNIRLQVEHTVTETLICVDLVKWQIRVSAGIPLDFEHLGTGIKGSAIECRINALAPGKIEMLHVAGGPFVRFDTFLMTGAEVTPYYDQLIGKLIVYAGTREQAIRKMNAALCELIIEGVPTNIEEQLDTIESEAFLTGEYDTTYFDGK